MAWTYREVASGDVNEVLAGMLNILNSLTPAQSLTVKTAASNQFHGDARGLVVWDTNPGPSGSPTYLPGSWMRRTETTDHDYTHMYEALVADLNNVSYTQAYYAGISMTNTHHGTATLSWFYRVEPNPEPIVPMPVGPF
jgi:hypothetical protein